MSNSRLFTPLHTSKVIFTVLLVFTISCNTKTESKVEPALEKEIQVEQTPGPENTQEVVEMYEPTDQYSMESPLEQTSDYIESPSDEPVALTKDFKVVLSVDSVMYLKQSGMMQVWIGQDDIDVAFSKGMTQDGKKIKSTVGRFAKITPYAPDFEIKALSSTVCYKIDPGGSEVRYSLTPKDEGEYKVSADIELYDTEDCTGISVPKTAKALSVFVGVNMKKEISKKVHEMGGVVWDKFRIFWIAFVTLIFGAAIFVARRYIRNKTGYEEGPSIKN